MMTVTLEGCEKMHIQFGEGATLTIVKVRNPSGYWNEVGVENRR